MHKRGRTKKLVDIYMVMVLLGVLLWIPFPVVGDLIGASSIIHAFLLVVGDTTKWIKYVSLVWILLFCFVLLSSYIVAWKKNEYKVIISISGIELLIAGIIIVYMICNCDFDNIITVLMGYIIRFLYFILMVFNYTTDRRQME